VSARRPTVTAPRRRTAAGVSQAARYGRRKHAPPLHKECTELTCVAQIGVEWDQMRREIVASIQQLGEVEGRRAVADLLVSGSADEREVREIVDLALSVVGRNVA
jgi:hypothetical protein